MGPLGFKIMSLVSRLIKIEATEKEFIEERHKEMRLETYIRENDAKKGPL